MPRDGAYCIRYPAHRICQNTNCVCNADTADSSVYHPQQGLCAISKQRYCIEHIQHSMHYMCTCHLQNEASIPDLCNTLSIACVVYILAPHMPCLCTAVTWQYHEMCSLEHVHQPSYMLSMISGALCQSAAHAAEHYSTYRQWVTAMP